MPLPLLSRVSQRNGEWSETFLLAYSCNISHHEVRSIQFNQINSCFDCNLDISNWLGASADTDAFGKALIGSGLSKLTIADWSVDPRVTLPGGQKGSVFDALEDMDVDDCLAKLVEMNKLNADTI